MGCEREMACEWMGVVYDKWIKEILVATVCVNAQILGSKYRDGCKVNMWRYSDRKCDGEFEGTNWLMDLQ